MTKQLSSETDLIENLRKRARSRTRVTLTEIWEDDVCIRKSRREQRIPPDPDAVAWLRENGYELEAD